MLCPCRTITIRIGRRGPLPSARCDMNEIERLCTATRCDPPATTLASGSASSLAGGGGAVGSAAGSVRALPWPLQAAPIECLARNSCTSLAPAWRHPNIGGLEKAAEAKRVWPQLYGRWPMMSPGA
eukprot:6259499-Prymnesium_polylepis.1